VAEIDALTEIAPPPESPFEAADRRRWADVEKSLGLTLPRDLFEFSDTYGSGEFRGGSDHCYRVANPCSKWFRRHVKTWQATYAELKANGVHAPFPSEMYPADPGLLCIGHGDSPIALFLSLRDRKLDGTVVALTFQRRWLRVSSGFVRFFTSVLRGDVDLFGFPGATGGGPWVFVPDSPPDSTVSPPLLEAALLDDPNRMRDLIAGGADPNSMSASGNTPLCSVDNEQMVRLLLELGADPNLADGQGQTPLLVACNSALPIGGLYALLEAGADPNVRDSAGMTPLMCACQYKGAEEVELLLQYGANTRLKDKQGLTARSHAESNPEILRVLEAKRKR
jgi:Ankyrin repeats (many copies)